MKIPTDQLKMALRKRKKEAGEDTRPAQRARESTRGEPVRAPEVPRATPPPAAASAGGNSRGDGLAVAVVEALTGTAEAGPSRTAPEVAQEAAKGGEQAVPPEEAVEEVPTAVGMAAEVAMLDPQGGAPIAAEPAEGRRVEGGSLAPVEPEMESVPLPAEARKLAPTPAGDEAEPRTAEGVEAVTPGAPQAETGGACTGEAGTSAPSVREKHRRTRWERERERSPDMPSRPAPKVTATEDAGKAERLLSEAR